MTFDDIVQGLAVFVDTNTFVYHFTQDPIFGPACTRFLDRIEQQEIQGFTSAQVLSEMAHRLMASEAMTLFGWPHRGIARRLRQHPAEVQQLNRYRQAIDEITLIGIQVLPVSGSLVSKAADYSQQFGLLSSDALIVAVMRDQGLTDLASNDADFDRVPGLTRYAPA